LETESPTFQQNKVKQLQKFLIALAAMFLLSFPAQSKEKISDQFTCLAYNIYYEAGSESYETKLAVAFVTLNRVQHKSYPKTICNVVYQACQFVWHCEGPKRKPSGPKWTESIKAAICAINSCVPNNIREVLFFHDNSIKYAYKNKKVVIILISDNMIFYKYKDNN